MNLENQAHVRLYRLDSNNPSGIWVLQLTQKTTDQKILLRLAESLKEEPTVGFLKFECFSSNGNMLGEILTSHIYLFDI